MLTRKAFKVATGAKDMSAAKAKLAAIASEVADESRKPFLLFLLSAVASIQAKATIDGQKVRGMFELIATEVASLYPAWREVFKIIGLLGELAHDAITGVLTAWKQGLLNEQGDAVTPVQAMDFCERIRFALRGRSFSEKLLKLKAIAKSDSARATDYDFLSHLVFQNDIVVTVETNNFERYIVAKATNREVETIDFEHIKAIREVFKNCSAQTLILKSQGKKGEDTFVSFDKGAGRPDALKAILDTVHEVAPVTGDAPATAQGEAQGEVAPVTGDAPATAQGEVAPVTGDAPAKLTRAQRKAMKLSKVA